MPKAAGTAALVRIRNSPGALALGDAPTSDNDSPRRAGPSIDEVGDLSIDCIIASATRATCAPSEQQQCWDAPTGAIGFNLKALLCILVYEFGGRPDFSEDVQVASLPKQTTLEL
jgi:hypothetical protein